MKLVQNALLWSVICLVSFGATAQTQYPIVGAERFDAYVAALRGLRIGLIVNQSSLTGREHLVDALINRQLDVRRIFAPEHGFRGKADAGKAVADERDKLTGLPIVSLYGTRKKPTAEDLADLDILVFDIQDVGVRFFTYISTMHFAMEAAAEHGLRFMVLDRPSPLGDYVDGPVLDTAFRSFVGMHPIPVVHGLTVGELAQMIKGEGWINKADSLRLSVVPCLKYTHNMVLPLRVKPSPNLPNLVAVRLYPSLCFFEATTISVGRGTEDAFQLLGYPNKAFGSFSFVPHDIKGMQMNPLHEGKTCWGVDLRKINPFEQRFTLKWFLDYMHLWKSSKPFVARERWFNLLMGTDKVLGQIKSGLTEDEIRATWSEELDTYKRMRAKYLLYPEN